MTGFAAESLRIESADLYITSNELKYLPLYDGNSRVSKLPVKLQSDTLQISLASSNGHQTHAIRLRRYPLRLQRAPCIQCPECEKWRKRLFLEADISTGSTSFRCRECMKDALP